MVRVRMKRLALIGTLCIVVFMALAPSALAHGNNSLAYSDISGGGGEIRYVLQMDMYDLRAATDPDDPEIGLSTPEVLNRFVTGSRESVERYILANTALYADGLPLKGKLIGLHVIQKEGGTQPFAEAVLTYPVQSMPEDFLFHYNLIFESDQWHVNYVKVDLGSLHKEGVIVSELKELEDGAIRPGYAGWHYGIKGTEELWTSWMTVLLMAILLTGTRTLKEGLAAAGACLGGLLLALAAAGLSWVSLPVPSVRYLLPLSLLCAALIVMQGRGQNKFLPGYAALFGFIHGLAVAGALAGLNAGAEVVPAVWTGFAAGAGAGLLAAAAVGYPVIWGLRRLGRSVSVIQAGAGIAGIVCIFIQL